MTNPAQLNYLDAMGIPVWVSRDLIQKNAPVVVTEAASNSKEGHTHDHIGSLLHDLETKKQQKTASQKPQPIEKQVVIPNYLVSTTPIEKQASEIARTSLHTVYACGDLNADWLVIGQAPDLSSNGEGQPFAGESGILLTKMLRAVGIEEPRRQAYLINIITSVANDTDIEKAQKNKLNQLLIEKIRQVNPKIVFVMGQLAAQNLLRSDEPLARLRGKDNKLSDLNIPLVVSYYPSYLLSRPSDKRKAWEDLKRAMKITATSF